MEWRQARRMAYAVALSVMIVVGLAAWPLRAAADGDQGGPGRDDRIPPGLAVTTQMRIEGLNGNNPTPIFSFSVGAASSATASGGGGGAGKVTFSNLTVSKGLDADSVPLLQAAATGQVLKTLTIEVSNGGRAPFAIYTFEDVVVSSSVIGASGSVDEQDAFDFRRITSDVTVNGQAFHSCFDVKANASCS